MKYIQHVILAVLFLVIVSCTKEESTSMMDEEVQQDSRLFVSKEQWEQNHFEWAEIQSFWFPKSIQATGLIDAPPQSIAKVIVPSGGYIKEFQFLEGEYVRKGQKLLTIENPDLVSIQKEYAQQVEQTSFLQSEVQRKKQLADEKIIARKEFLKTEADWQQANRKQAALKKQLQLYNLSPTQIASGVFTSYINVYSPISGYVADIKVVKGSHVSPSQEIVTIIDTDHLHLELEVFEKDIAQVKKGQSILFRVPEVSTDTLKAEVKLIDALMGENRKINVHGHFLPNDLHLMIGMFVDGTIIIDSLELPSLPETAFVEREGTFEVLVLDEETADGFYLDPVRVVSTGQLYNGYRTIRDTTLLNKRFLKAGGFQLID